jgi:hypothetical protein
MGLEPAASHAVSTRGEALPIFPTAKRRGKQQGKRRYELFEASALGSSCPEKHLRKSLLPWGTFPRWSVERRGCWGSPRARNGRVGYVPFPKGMGAPTSMAPLKGETACMDALSRLFPAHYGTQRVAPTGHVPSVPTTREWKKPLGFNRCGECHKPIQLLPQGKQAGWNCHPAGFFLSPLS